MVASSSGEGTALRIAKAGPMSYDASAETTDGTLQIPAGRVKRIHVNQHVIRANTKTGAREPPISVKTSRDNFRCHAIEIDGPSRLVYSPVKPLSCGARLWIETHAPLTLRQEVGS